MAERGGEFIGSVEDFGIGDMDGPEGRGYDVAVPDGGSGVVGRDIVIGGEGREG